MNGFAVIFILVVLPLLAGWGGVSRQKTTTRDVWGGLMLSGFGLAKGLLLALPIFEIHRLCNEALPEAQNGWSAFIGMLSFALLPYLWLSAISDVRGGGDRLFKREASPWVRDPFWTSGAVDFWSRWGPVTRPGFPAWRSVLAGLAMAMLLSWRGFSEGLVIWILLHGLLIVLDYLLGCYAGWFRVPKQVRGVLGACLFVLSMPLIYKGSWEAVVAEWHLLFNPPARTVYTLFLDRRLASWQVCWVMWGAVLTAVAVPGYSWWMERPQPVRKAVRWLGLFCFFAFAAFLAGLVIPGSSQLLRWWDAGPVYSGNDGWLYPIQEIDRLTQKRIKPGLAEKVLSLKKELEDQGAKLLLLPVPDKVTLYPEPVLPAKYWAPVLPPGYVNEVERLRAAGVDVLDLMSLFWDRRDRQPFYFKQDSHWTAEAMKEVAVQTSRHIRKTYPHVVKQGTPMVDAVFMERRDVGDLAWTRNPGYTKDYWKEETSQMVGLRGLKGAEASPVLVIGGSLVRIYDDPRLTFGLQLPGDAPAAFPIQLGALIGRALEVADEGWRDEYVRRSQGKKLVIWVVRAGEL